MLKRSRRPRWAIGIAAVLLLADTWWFDVYPVLPQWTPTVLGNIAEAGGRLLVGWYGWRQHCQLSGPRAPFCGPAQLEQGSTIGEQRTSRPEPPRHRHNE